MNAKTTTALAKLPPRERAIQVMGVEHTKAQLIELAKESTTIKSAEGKDNYDATHAARMKLKNTRVAIQKTGKAAREDATAFSKAVIAVEGDLIALIEPEEKRLQALQDEQDAIIEAEKAAIAAREAERVAKVEASIKAMRDVPLMAVGQPAEAIREQIEWLEQQDDECFEGDYLEQAQAAKRQSMAQLKAMLDAEVRAQEERAEAKRRQAELDARQAEIDAREAAAKEEADRVAAAQAEAQRKLDEQQAEIDRQRREEEDRRRREEEEAKEAARIEAERIEQEQAAAQEAEQAAAIQREIDTADIKDAIRDAAFYLRDSAGPQSKVYRKLVAAAGRHFNEEF